MNKKLFGIFGAIFVALTLAGCSSTELTTGAATKKADGMVAVIKGKVKSDAKVSYQVNNSQTKTTKNTSGSYMIEVPPTTKDQTVKVTAKSSKGSTTKKVTIKSATALATYTNFKNSYNQAVVGMNLSKADQQKAKDLQTKSAELKKQPKVDPAKLKAQLAAMPADKRAAEMAKLNKLKKEGAQLKAEGAELTKTMNQIKKAKADQLLPDKPATGVSQLIKQPDYQIRGNYQDDKLIGLTVIAPTKALKTKTGAKNFGTAFGVAAKELGADPTAVMKKFKKYQKDAKSGQTTINTINSNGVKFNVGFSTTNLYIYITK